MKTLVIHPDDRSTDFLKPIYANLTDATIVTGGVTKKDVAEMIKTHDRIMMMGHGSPSGLFSVGKFISSNPSNLFNGMDYGNGYIIDDTMVSLLNEKENNVFIWCNADKFVTKHDLKGFYSGMFISEVSEANYCGLPGTPQETVDTSNHYFAQLLGEVINDPLKDAYFHVLDNYGLLAEGNPVALYNYNRLYLND